MIIILSTYAYLDKMTHNNIFIHIIKENGKSFNVQFLFM